MFLLLDVFAAIVTLPTLLLDLRAMIAPPSHASWSARLFRRCDALTGHRLSTFSYVALSYLIARAAFVVMQSGWPVAMKGAALVALAFVTVALVQPLTSVYNSIGELFWRNPPLHLDKALYFPASLHFEQPPAFAAIRAETERVVADAHPFSDIYRNITVLEPSQSPRDGWRSFHLRIADRDLEENQARMPATSALLRTMPEVCNAFVSIIDGEQRLAPHRGYFKGIVRYHLGILVPEPEQAVLFCGGERYHWREGEGVLFDDMFVHSVENRSSKPRAILFLDVRRPVGLIGQLVREPLAWIIEHHPYHVAARERARR